MKQKNNIFTVLILFSTIFLFIDSSKSQSTYDSLNIKLPKHYFQTVILLDGYRKPIQNIKDTVQLISERLKTFGVKQFVFSLSTPIATIERNTSDSTVKKNTHILLTANYMRFIPLFNGISEHELVKIGLGVRIIVNPGKKGIWFFDLSPFSTKDVTYPSKAYHRFASTIVYSHNKSERFNWRIGATKSFLWGNRFYMPFIGFRFGKLDKTNFSIQFPKIMSLNFPINENIGFSIYTKPQGGMWNFSNRDSIYNLNNDATFQFTRYEIVTGFRLDARVKDWFSFYLATGFSTENKITFYSNTANKDNKNLPLSKYFYVNNLAPTMYLNTGLVFKFGKTRSYQNNRNIYDAIDLNNTIGAGDNAINKGNTQIPLNPKRKKEDLKLKSVQDLVDYNDF